MCCLFASQYYARATSAAAAAAAAAALLAQLGLEVVDAEVRARELLAQVGQLVVVAARRRPRRGAAPAVAPDELEHFEPPAFARSTGWADCSICTSAIWRTETSCISRADFERS